MGPTQKTSSRKREMPVLVTSQLAALVPLLLPSTPPQFRMPSFWVFSSLYSELLSCPSSEFPWARKPVTDTDTSNQLMLMMNQPQTTVMLRGRSIQLPRFSGNGSSRRQIQLNKFATFAEYLLSNLLLHFSTSTSPFSTQVLRNLPQISTKMTCVFFPIYSTLSLNLSL